MDPISHTVLGAAVGYAVAGKSLGRKAALWGAIAGAAPDLDIFIRDATNPLVGWTYHRHFTHALSVGVAAGAIVAIVTGRVKALRQKALSLGACVTGALFSHGLLDAATGYGTLLLWPFSNQRVSWDIYPIIDPVFSGGLLLLLLIGLVKASPRSTAATLGIFLACYTSLALYQHHRAIQAVTALASERSDTILRHKLSPQIGSLLLWRSIYETPTGEVQADALRLPWGKTQVLPGEKTALVKQAPRYTSPELQEQADGYFNQFNWFTQGWVIQLDGENFGDARYSSTLSGFTPLWGLKLDATATPTRADLQRHPRDLQKLLDATFKGTGFPPQP